MDRAAEGENEELSAKQWVLRMSRSLGFKTAIPVQRLVDGLPNFRDFVASGSKLLHEKVEVPSKRGDG